MGALWWGGLGRRRTHMRRLCRHPHAGRSSGCGCDRSMCLIRKHRTLRHITSQPHTRLAACQRSARRPLHPSAAGVMTEKYSSLMNHLYLQQHDCLNAHNLYAHGVFV